MMSKAYILYVFMHFRYFLSMELRQIRYLATVAEEGNVSRAAVRLHISQPALSRQIHALEQRLGVTLVERHGRGIRLTRAGNELLPRFTELVSRAAALAEQARALDNDASYVLRVGATPHFIESAVAPALHGFRSDYPAVDVVLVEQVSNRLVQLLERDEVQLVLGARGLVGPYQTRTLSPIPLTLVPPGGHPFLERRQLDVSDLLTEPLLLLRRGFLTRDIFESACQLAHIVPSVRQESDSVHTLLALVEAGAGSAVVQANAKIGRPAIPLSQGGQLLSVELLAAWNPHSKLMPGAAGLIDAVDKALGEKVRLTTTTAIRG